MFGKPKKVKELGKPRNEAERKKVNKRIKDKYGYEEHFKAPEKKKLTPATEKVIRGYMRSGLSRAEALKRVDK